MAQCSKNTHYSLNFRMCGKFSSKPGTFAEKWLRKFEYKMHGLRNTMENIWPFDYLPSIEILLVNQVEI